MSVPKIILNASDHGTWRIPALSYTINKFWPNHPEVIILGYSKPDFELDNNFSFVSIKEEDRGPRFWAEDQIDFFESFGDEYFINWLDDYLLISRVWEDKLEFYCRQIDFHPEIDVIHISGSHCNELDRWGERLSWGKEHPTVLLKDGVTFNLSLQASLWRSSSYLKALNIATDRNLDIWQFEKKINPSGEFKVAIPIQEPEVCQTLPLYVSEISVQTCPRFFKKTKREDPICTVCYEENHPDRMGFGFLSKYPRHGERFKPEKQIMEDVKNLLSKHCPYDYCPLK